MNKRLQGIIAGIVIGAAVASGIAFAQSATRTIEVSYDNIKVYKDNVLCELKDANGNIVEPFIYEGTTYLPIRAVANMFGMNVEWEESAKSIYLSADESQSTTVHSLVEQCPPYDGDGYAVYTLNKGKAVTISGKNYYDAVTLKLNGWYNNQPGYALFALDKKYNNVSFDVGHVDSTGKFNVTINILLDDELAVTKDITYEGLPIHIDVNVKNASQMKIQMVGSGSYSSSPTYGIINAQIE